MSANSEVKQSKRSLEISQWILVVILLGIAIVSNYYLRPYNIALRIITVVTMILIASGIALCTEKGKATVALAREASIEMRKVIWPTHQEAFQITLIVAVVTTVMAIFFWGLDCIQVRFISYIIGLRF